MKIFQLFMVVFFLCSCDNNDAKNPIGVGHANDFVYDMPANLSKGNVLADRQLAGELIRKAINKNDTMAYSKVATDYIMANMGQEFFYCALTMANRNNYPAAYYDVYIIIKESKSSLFNGDTLLEIDERNQNLGVAYLLKSYEMGYSSAKYHIDELFPDKKSIPKSSQYFAKFSQP